MTLIKFGITLISASLLTACLPETQSPSEVAQLYWNAVRSGDAETAKLHVSVDTQSSFNEYMSLPEARKIPVQEVHIGDQRATVTTIFNPSGEASGNYRSFETVLVLENNKWKVDATSTRVPAPVSATQKELDELAEQMSDSMQHNMESLDETVNEGLQMLNEALREGSQEMGQSLLKGMEELNRKMRESIDKMKQRRDMNNTTNNDDGEGMI